MDQLGADERHSPHDGRADSQPPVRVLIESENLPRKGHPQRTQEQAAAAYPSQLTRVFVSSEQEGLDQMGGHDAHHEDRSPVVDRAQKPAQKLFVVEILEARPGLTGRRLVDESQKSPGENLQNKTQ